MYINILATEFGKPFLSFFQGFFERVRVGPSEKVCVSFRVIVLQVMCPRYLEVLFCVIEVPSNSSCAPFPFHRMRVNTINWSETHLIKFALKTHIAD